MSFIRSALIGGLVLTATFVGASEVAAQTTHIVDQINFTFAPQDITIEVGDTVEWRWTSGDHTVTEGTGPFPTGGEAFNSLLQNTTPVFSVTFDASFLAANPRPGNVYDYYCVPHLAFGQIGSVTVSAGPPAIPTMGEWGVIVLSVLLLGAGAFVIMRRREVPTAA